MNRSELKVINQIKNTSKSLFMWFQNNCMKVNPDKFHLLLRDRKIHRVDIFYEKLPITCSEKLLEIKINNKLTFEEGVKGLCEKTSQKGNVMARTSFLIRIEQRQFIYNFLLLLLSIGLDFS